MRSGSEVPYYLRPNKHIDRELFLELLGRTVPNWGPEKYCYFSMGGRHLVDHKLVYRRLGIQHLFSIDNDAKVVERQKFNRPIESAICELMNASKMASEFSDLLGKMTGPDKAIIWLDYSSSRNRLNQITDFAKVAVQLAPGEIARLTLNAQISTLGSEEMWKAEQQDAENPLSLAEYKANWLRSKLGTMLPASVTEVDQNSLPNVLLDCVRLQLDKAGAFRLKSGNQILPVLSTCYNDGHYMLTVTVICVEPTGDLPIGLRNWQYLCPTWNDILLIQSPDLSTREQTAIDRILEKSDEDILSETGFLPKDAGFKRDSLDSIRSYRDYRRFYPEFRNTDGI